MTKPLLSVAGLRAGHEGSTVLDGIDFSLPQDGALLIMGRNGAGKSTLLETLMGLTHQLSGRIELDGKDLSSLSAVARSHAGLAWVPQTREIFPSLTVAENLRVVRKPGPWTQERVYDLFPRLKERERNYGNQLSGGEQQMLALGRALMTNPRLLLLDEPVEGLSPIIVTEMMEAIAQLRRREQMSIIIVEQKYSLALPVVEQVLVMDHGKVVFTSTAQEASERVDLLARMIAVD